MALELKKTMIAKMPGAKKASLELPDIEAGLGAGGLLGGDAGVPCLEGFLGGRDGFSGFDAWVDVGAVNTPRHVIIIIVVSMIIIMIGITIITTTTITIIAETWQRYKIFYILNLNIILNIR